MMRTLRDKRFMHFVLWMIIIVFIGGIFFMWGMKSTGFENKDPNLIAKVGETKITFAEFNKACQPVLDKLYRSEEESPDPAEIKKLKEQVLDRLVDDAILEQTAQNLGVSVSDDELVGWLQHQSYFLDDSGKFDKGKYYQILQANQLTPKEFEDSQRKQILLQKIQSILFDGILYTTDGVNDYSKFLNRDLKTDYVSLDLETYEKKVIPSESDLREYYQSHKSQYDHPERAKIRHILIGLQGNESLQDQDKAKTTLEDYRKEILAKKATFGELARKYSQDGGSKDKSGELGWVSRNSMGKDLQDFEDMVFKLKKGDLSKPTRTKYGYHLVQLEDYEKEYKSTFDSVHSKVLAQYQSEKAAQKILALSEQLVDKLKENEGIGKAAQELGLSATTTTWFNRHSGIPGIKNSTDLSDELAGLYLKDWKGPLESGKKEYFFQLTDAKSGKADSENAAKDLSDATQRLITSRQEVWTKNFLDNQRKKLNVKIFLNS